MATRAQIRTRVRQRADIQSDTVRFPDSELDQYINDGLRELQVELLPLEILKDEALHEFTADGSSNYALPDDYLSTISVWKQDGDRVRRLRRHRSSDKPFGVLLLTSSDAYCYRTARFNGVKSLELNPRATSGTYLHTYTPVIQLTADTDEVDSELGWDEYLVLYAAIQCYQKDNLDKSVLQVDLEKKLAKIIAGAEAQDRNEGYIMRGKHPEYVDPADADLIHYYEGYSYE